MNKIFPRRKHLDDILRTLYFPLFKFTSCERFSVKKVGTAPTGRFSISTDPFNASRQCSWTVCQIKIKAFYSGLLDSTRAVIY